MTSQTPITVARGDGIGPEIMDACLKILDAADANLAIDEIRVGKTVYEEGNTSGIEEGAWEKIRATGVLLKAPITTPQGGGYKSINVTMRKTFGLYANLRPVRAYYPFVFTRYPATDLVIVRENEEDLYAGIEHRQTQEVYQALKLISRPGSERVIRYAFEYAKRNERKKVTCFTKDNIMKLTDGTFHRLFDKVAEEYPDIEHDHWIIDIGAAKVATTPEAFDVIVMPNLYGDVVSDIAAQLTGSVGLAGSANIGQTVAMFEAVHGSAPDIAGRGIANPSGLLLGAIMMLVHISHTEAAEQVHNAWLRTLEDGIHTGDIHNQTYSTHWASTDELADAIIERLGEVPQTLKPVSYADTVDQQPISSAIDEAIHTVKQLVGVDLFIDWSEGERDPDAIGGRLSQINGDGLKLKMITNRGVKVWPGGQPETFRTDHWRCRFVADGVDTITQGQVINLLTRADAAGWDCIKTENLYTFDGEAGYSLGQGE
ncbi:MAG: NADP-dependent isocitrate dehydrogenase [Chloroflexi bacterium]|nr:NADP-dependent isocitrate dehydrogenase [Chloroflexota bacterium]